MAGSSDAAVRGAVDRRGRDVDGVLGDGCAGSGRKPFGRVVAGLRHEWVASSADRSAGPSLRIGAGAPFQCVCLRVRALSHGPFAFVRADVVALGCTGSADRAAGNGAAGGNAVRSVERILLGPGTGVGLGAGALGGFEFLRPQGGVYGLRPAADADGMVDGDDGGGRGGGRDRAAGTVVRQQFQQVVVGGVGSLKIQV